MRSEIMSTYSNRIAEKKADNVNNLDTVWVTTVKDHRELLFQNGTWLNIDAPTMKLYSHRIEEFLMDKHKIPHYHAWIVLWINNIPSNVYFVKIRRLFVPSMQYLDTLEEQYRNAKAQVTGHYN